MDHGRLARSLVRDHDQGFAALMVLDLPGLPARQSFNQFMEATFWLFRMQSGCREEGKLAARVSIVELRCFRLIPHLPAGFKGVSTNRARTR